MNKSTIVILALVVAFLVWRWWSGRRSPEQLDLMRSAVASGGLLVDVRTPREFAAGHPSDAVNIPLDQLTQRLDELGDRDRPIVVCCQSGARSRAAADSLTKQGFGSVMDLGPCANWER